MVKHRGLLSGFLKMWETKHGFNAAQELQTLGKPPVPANTVPTLTMVVNSTTFRTHLFALGYHWKDPGVGVQHGEFTHRIQWYIAIQANNNNRLLLHRRPIEIFKMCADNLCLGVGKEANKTVWDAIFDRLGDTTTDFRSPERMHTWFNDTNQQNDKNVGILAQLIRGRTLKRVNKEFNVVTLKDKEKEKTIKILGATENMPSLGIVPATLTQRGVETLRFSGPTPIFDCFSNNESPRGDSKCHHTSRTYAAISASVLT